MQKTLFLLHFAGGNCFSYRFLEPYLKDFRVIALELPGRGRRYDEPLIYDFKEAASDIYQQLLAHLDTPDFLIMGHSMGALLGLKLTSMLEQTGFIPATLIVGGSSGPLRNRKHHHLLNNKDLKSYLKNMGGFSEEVLNNHDLFEYLYPIIQADLRIAEINTPDDFLMVNCPVHAIMGTQEKEAVDIQNWRQFTRGEFSQNLLVGGHFFIHRWPKEIADIIRLAHLQVNS